MEDEREYVRIRKVNRPCVIDGISYISSVHLFFLDARARTPVLDIFFASGNKNNLLAGPGVGNGTDDMYGALIRAIVHEYCWNCCFFGGNLTTKVSMCVCVCVEGCGRVHAS